LLKGHHQHDLPIRSDSERKSTGSSIGRSKSVRFSDGIVPGSDLAVLIEANNNSNRSSSTQSRLVGEIEETRNSSQTGIVPSQAEDSSVLANTGSHETLLPLSANSASFSNGSNSATNQSLKRKESKKKYKITNSKAYYSLYIYIYI
jgi:hypothetical protein